MLAGPALPKAHSIGRTALCLALALVSRCYAGTSIVPSRYLVAWPAISTRSPRASQKSSPPRGEIWRAKRPGFPRRSARWDRAERGC